MYVQCFFVFVFSFFFLGLPSVTAIVLHGKWANSLNPLNRQSISLSPSDSLTHSNTRHNTVHKAKHWCLRLREVNQDSAIFHSFHKRSVKIPLSRAIGLRQHYPTFSSYVVL